MEVAVRVPERLRRSLHRVVGRKFVKHYVAPRRMSEGQRPYDAKAFFESWHRATGDLSDAATIAAGKSPLESKYHYNAVENSIIECLARRALPRPLTVLDIGTGAGHWIDFYSEVFRAERIVGVEISSPAAGVLREKYHADGVEIVEGDVSLPDFELGERFGIVNAVGVMFHIIDDERWTTAVRNLTKHLQPDGVLVVGGQFGLVTQNVQFHRTDSFRSWEEFRGAAGGGATLVNKRIRSLRRWRECARAAGLEIECLKRTRGDRDIQTPENNILVLAGKR